MSESKHTDTSHAWLIFFFACFAIAVLGIGIWAFANYKVDAPQDQSAGGGHSMLIPADHDRFNPLEPVA